MRDLRVEAARYSVLRRLMPAIRHDMVGSLNPLGMLCEVLYRRLLGNADDYANLLQQVEKIRHQSAVSIQSCRSLMTWMEPTPGRTVGVSQGIAECIELLRPGFNVRGFALENTVPQADPEVSCAALRAVLSAALMAVVDAAKQPADILIRPTHTPPFVTISITSRATQREATFGNALVYRKITWDDVAALVEAEAVEISLRDNEVLLHFPQLETSTAMA